MPKITINNQEIDVPEGLTIIQACELSGIEIPRFCYHERLAIAGNCRMCLVEVEKAPKLVASCAMQIADGMVIHTNSTKVENARAGVMELLLINHPLDCPICDQGGECDLQDQAFKYGKPLNRFHENKRAVADKEMGPLIKTHMTRCIHCTRCVRFAEEIAGTGEVGAIFRGEHTEITTLEKIVESELSGNMIDICPVGALTSKPYAFKARSWELKKTYSIDVTDAVGSNIRIDSRSLEVMRILPIVNEDVNEEWISDKARFSYDGLKMQRIDRSYINVDGRFVEATLEEVLSKIALRIKGSNPSKIGAIAGTLVDCESLYSMKALMNSIGSKNIDFNQFGYKLDYTSRGNYIFNSSICGIDKSDLCLLVGANPRHVAPVLNIRIGRGQRSGRMHVARVGEVDNQTYKVEELGCDLKILEEILSGDHSFSKRLVSAKNPMIIMGDGIFSRDDSIDLQKILFNISKKYDVIRDDWNGFNILHNHASSVGAIDIGFYPQDGGISVKEMTSSDDMELLFLLGADDICIDKRKNAFVVYIGHHGDRSAMHADIVIPAPAYTEKDAIYINTEGRAQKAYAAVKPPLHAIPDWQVVVKLAHCLKYDIGFDNLDSLRINMSRDVPAIAHINNLIKSDVRYPEDNKQTILVSESLKKIPINFYMTDQISRASVTMAKCTESRK